MTALRRWIFAVVSAAVLVAPMSAQSAGPNAGTAKKLRAGQRCSKKKQSYYHKHGFECHATDAGLRLTPLGR